MSGEVAAPSGLSPSSSSSSSWSSALLLSELPGEQRGARGGALPCSVAPRCPVTSRCRAGCGVGGGVHTVQIRQLWPQVFTWRPAALRPPGQLHRGSITVLWGGVGTHQAGQTGGLPPTPKRLPVPPDHSCRAGGTPDPTQRLCHGGSLGGAAGVMGWGRSGSCHRARGLRPAGGAGWTGHVHVTLPPTGTDTGEQLLLAGTCLVLLMTSNEAGHGEGRALPAACSVCVRVEQVGNRLPGRRADARFPWQRAVWKGHCRGMQPEPPPAGSPHSLRPGGHEQSPGGRTRGRGAYRCREARWGAESALLSRAGSTRLQHRGEGAGGQG